MQIEKVYEPGRFEAHWARWWIENGIFTADRDKPGAVFSMVIPPPNVTGSLHMGHMLDHTIMDACTRWHRMKGDNTLWLPGTDHAGIATQMVVERQLAEQGTDRHQLGREEFLRRVWAWKEKYGNRITDQMKAIGDSVDWSREQFTFSPQLSRAVTEAFIRLYEKGLIYRGEYMINWCPRCRTALSDLETAHEETQGSLWHIRYPVTESDRWLTVATTRPETMLGDTAVAINARDERYQDLHGRTVNLPLMDRQIPIVLDEMADPEFGSGVVKVTPAHDPNDFEAGKRHHLPHLKVIDEEARMTSEAGPYAGLDRFEARRRVVADLERLGLLEKVQPYVLPLATCSRCKTVIEPLVSKQWFVRMKPLAEKAIEAVESGAIRFLPENWNATYFNWMRNIRDWCISRQLWWGHRIPAWHCEECGRIVVGREAPGKCPHCGSNQFAQDPDVLDTWFSSGLWPFSTLGWPDQTPDVAKYYPTSLLITGFDILFFWVARMIVMGIECTGEVPFRVVHMHGLVRDAEKQKMSKTKGNTIDPLDITAQYGTDAVRMSLLKGVAAGTDIVYTEDRLTTARNFSNKLWNAARLIFMNMERSGVEPVVPGAAAAEAIEDRWMFSRLNCSARRVSTYFEQHRYNDVAEELWSLFWDHFCDWYLEVKKLRLAENTGLDDHWRNLLYSFTTILKLLHPAIPFITEELWHRIDPSGASIAVQPWPQPREDVDLGPEPERDMELLQLIVTEIRNLRADQKVDKKQRVTARLYCRPDALAVAETEHAIIERLGNVSLHVSEQSAPHLSGAVRSNTEFDLVIELPDVDKSALRGRLEKEIAQLAGLIARTDAQLSNEKFMKGAPARVIESMREKRSEYTAELQKKKEAHEALA